MSKVEFFGGRRIKNAIKKGRDNKGLRAHRLNTWAAQQATQEQENRRHGK